ncbi:hypothetical protein [Streptomyces goshikiensis]|uniref:hypothetical protein n=1 Tax=Streptomyces goshikiensis TaxID=1942 RepID=UPI0019AF8254|nr:hypothetical protein [Streptomyces goshikiensis]GHD80116.1 hypothetical protein GCM10010336_63320 [Streptomyces goshikiensis]
MLVVRGCSSQSYADVVRDRVAHEQREAHLAVVGDFDCSGEDIERDWVERTGCWSSVTQVLLTCEQVRAYGLPATEGKRGDPRWPAFARRYGFDIERPVQWEVEALEPDELRRLVLAAVAPYIDRDVLAQQIAREEQQRRVLGGFLDGWRGWRGRPGLALQQRGATPRRIALLTWCFRSTGVSRPLLHPVLHRHARGPGGCHGSPGRCAKKLDSLAAASSCSETLMALQRS